MPLYRVQWKDYCNLSWPPTVNIVFTVITVLHPVYTPIRCSPNLWQFPLSSGVPLYFVQWKDCHDVSKLTSNIVFTVTSGPHPVCIPIRSSPNLWQYFCLLMCHYTWFYEATTETFSQTNTISSVVSCNHSWFGTTKAQFSASLQQIQVPSGSTPWSSLSLQVIYCQHKYHCTRSSASTTTFFRQYTCPILVLLRCSASLWPCALSSHLP